MPWKNKEDSRKSCKAWKLKTKLAVFALLGGKCFSANCRWLNDDGSIGCTDHRALQVDHVNGKPNVPNHYKNSGVLYGRGSTGLYVKILKGLVDISDFQLLCANCNWIKRFRNEGGNESTARKIQ